MQSKEAKRYLKVGDWWYLPEMDNFVRFDSSGKIVAKTDFDNLCQKTINFFVQNPGRLVSREELLAHAWGRLNVTDSSINRVIRVLRQTMGDNKGSPVYFQTISKVGYRFIASVTEEYLPVAEKPWVQGISQAELPPVFLPQKKKFPRHQLMWMLLLMLLLALLLSWQLLLTFTKDPATVVSFARFQRLSELPGIEFAPALSPDGLSLAYIHQDSSCTRSRLMLKNMKTADTKLLLSLPTVLATPQWSPDGRALFYQVDSSDTTTVVRRLSLNAQLEPISDQLLFSLSNGTISGDMRLSPDGQLLVYQAKMPAQSQTQLWFYHLNTKQHEQITVLPTTGLADIAAVFSKQGTELAFIRKYQHHKSEVWLMDLKTRSSRLLHEVQGEAPRTLSWSTDDRALLFSRSGRQLLRLDIATGQIRDEIHTDQKALAMHATAQGQVLAVIGEFWRYAVMRYQNPSMSVQRASSDAKGTEAYPSSRNIFAIQPNPQLNGPTALYSERSGQRQVWWYYQDGRQRQISNFSHDHQVHRMVFSPDGRQLAVAYGDEIWLLSAEHQPIRASAIGQSSQQPSWSADGRYLYFVAAEKGRNQLIKMDIQTQRQVRDPQFDYLQSSQNGGYQVFRRHNAEPFKLKFESSGQEIDLPFLAQLPEYPVLVLGQTQLYFAEPKDKYQALIKVFHLNTQQVTETGLLMSAASQHFALSADERWFYLPQTAVGESDIAQLLPTSSTNVPHLAE